MPDIIINNTDVIRGHNALTSGHLNNKQESNVLQYKNTLIITKITGQTGAGFCKTDLQAIT